MFIRSGIRAASLLLSISLLGCGNFLIANVQQEESESPNEPRILWSATARLQPIEDKEGMGGFVEVNINENRIVTPSIRLSLPPPPEKGHYEAWLLREEPSGILSLGPLLKGNHGSYYLGQTSLNFEKDFLDYKTVLITMEPTEPIDKQPTKPLLKGTLKIVGGLNLRGQSWLQWLQ